MKKEILEGLKWRYAVQVFDKEKKVSQDDLHAILESGRLAPSSYGLEPWKFIVVENSETRLKLQEAGFDQSKISEASHLVVLARRTNTRLTLASDRITRTAKAYGQDAVSLSDFREMLDGSIERLTDEALDFDNRAQVYLALGVMLATSASLGVDCAPMGGFIPSKYDEILGLSEQNLSATLLLTLGYRGEDQSADRPKVRRDFESVVAFVK